MGRRRMFVVDVTVELVGGGPAELAVLTAGEATLERAVVTLGVLVQVAGTAELLAAVRADVWSIGVGPSARRREHGLFSR